MQQMAQLMAMNQQAMQMRQAGQQLPPPAATASRATALDTRPHAHTLVSKVVPGLSCEVGVSDARKGA